MKKNLTNIAEEEEKTFYKYFEYNHDINNIQIFEMPSQEHDVLSYVLGYFIINKSRNLIGLVSADVCYLDSKNAQPDQSYYPRRYSFLSKSGRTTPTLVIVIAYSEPHEHAVAKIHEKYAQLDGCRIGMRWLFSFYICSLCIFFQL